MKKSSLKKPVERNHMLTVLAIVAIAAFVGNLILLTLIVMEFVR